ncbi:hypothetical protein [Saccharopolyspora oryzae]|uniref:CopG family transcriptional regulator n=1 Tax=Saccharopolyspora oryzae TaxID=2997343 RepID=A0ABT4V0E6_9PSEU|nr:hypothetical protein [Saccharopolyspora oryzae]MDA3627443.1 hypothetical protein [Saccharopolyspora oryzae]
MALGRTKTSRRQKAAEPAEPDHEFESYLAALAPEESVESTGSGRRFGAAQVYQLRLPLMANERLKELAFKQGTSPAALARDWVMQHLALEEDNAAAAPAAPMHQPAPAEYSAPLEHAAPDEYTVVDDYAAPVEYGAPQADPMWPDQDTQKHFQPVSEPPVRHDAYGDVEQTEEITVPQNRFRH